jgi:hypothetical protein
MAPVAGILTSGSVCLSLARFHTWRSQRGRDEWRFCVMEMYVKLP